MHGGRVKEVVKKYEMAVKSGRGGSLLKDLNLTLTLNLTLMYQLKSQRVSWVGSGLPAWSGWGLW